LSPIFKEETAVSVDWKVVDSALQQSRDGNHLKAISTLSVLLSDAESNRDRAAILLGQSSCHSQAGNLAKSRELLESAKMCAREDRDLLSQVALSEASLCAQNDEHDLACEKFASVKSEYSDLLARPEHDDFALELDSRLACSLVQAGKFSEAIDLFQGLFKREKLEDKQRLLLFFGVALLRTGNLSEAQPLLFEAMTGNDPTLSQTASDYLSTIGRTSLKS
jgi:tetratricopeptide (TPR) repeat protein